MELASKYNSSESEKKWYKYWLENDFFHSEPDERESYTVLIPPPNVTGSLHMGHMLNNSIQDILVRRARLLGKNACWVPGMDHASIATEAKVVNKLKSEGKDKHKIGRDAFLDEAWLWKEKHGGLILEQLKKLGASCDWKRTKFTMDDDLSASVYKIFIDLYDKGLIYRGDRIVNWDSGAKTALSDEEVIHKEVNSQLFYVKYKLENSDEYITIATTRPETILGDTGICVNPNDSRYQKLIGSNAIVPLIGRVVPIISDDYVDVEFGTGCLKVTPAHDINDYQIGVKHKLEVINLFNEDGTLNENAKILIGMDRFAARKEVAKLLEDEGLLVKTEQITNSLGYSERTNVVVEPRISKQWFCDMSEMAKPALEHVMNDEVQFHPAKFKNTYRHWMENIKEWCISRQLWWGHRIPAWYNEKGEHVAAMDEKEAIQKFKNKGLSTEKIHQDDDVLDTWFSSWLWPLSVFNGINDPRNKEIEYYYPTNDLVTGPDIIFFWVARMIMMSYYFENEKPFKNVYFTGIVRDSQRRKMSKQLGNSPNPLDLIEQYGADGVRVGMLLSAPAGNDLLFDENLCQQGRNFSNKLWNAFRLVKGWEVSDSLEQPETSSIAIQWFEAKLSSVIGEIDKSYGEFRISEALMNTYKLVWDEFCSWFLEMIKPNYQQPIDRKTFDKTVSLFEKVTIIVHPFMPFITEEIWQYLNHRESGETIMFQKWPEGTSTSDNLVKEFENTKQIISSIRTFRKEKNISQNDNLELKVLESKSRESVFDGVIVKLSGLNSFQNVNEGESEAHSFIVNGNEYYIPFEEKIDPEKERTRLKKEIEYTKGFLTSIQKKLENERFVSNAPEEVVVNERKKKSDAEVKIQILEKQLEKLT